MESYIEIADKKQASTTVNPPYNSKTWYERVSRTTSSGQFIPEVDGLRFIAIITVVLLHLNTHLLRVNGPSLQGAEKTSTLYPFLFNGGLGVLLFFVISGFVLALPFASFQLGKTSKMPNLKSYYLRRLTRLEPPYILTLLFFFVALVVSKYGNLADLLPHLLASLFYVHFFAYGYWSPINPVAWSLETEVQFYLVAPFIAGFFAIRNKAVKWGLFFIIMITIPALVQFFMEKVNEWHIGKSVLAFFPLFFVGFVLAEFYQKYTAFFKKKSPFWDMLGLISIIGLYLSNDSMNAYLRYAFATACAILLIAAFKGKWLNRALTTPFISTTGGMCYSIYLLHYPIIAVVGNYIAPHFRSFSYEVQYLLFALLMLPPLYGVSSVFFILIEKPCMDKNWLQKIKHFVARFFWRKSLNKASNTFF